MISAAKSFLVQHKKYTPVVFYAGGFIWDSLTLGRIDSWYSSVILLTYLVALTISIYIFNLAGDNHWQKTFWKSGQEYAPLAIQFFLGGLSSAYVIFFFQSVSLTKSMVFFIILVFLFISNEIFKHRISNKYLQLGAYYFVNFTFFIFFLPVMLGAMNTFLFILSGILSLVTTYYFIRYIFEQSSSTRKELRLSRLGAIIAGIYLFINICYYFNLIPPVPLSLQSGLVAYDIEKTDNTFIVSYDKPLIPGFWTSFNPNFNYTENDTVYVFTSVFAPSNLTKSILHRWKMYNAGTETWNTTDEISYKVTGGRKGGYRGYTYKTNVHSGLWRVDVITQEGLVLGEIDFEISESELKSEVNLTRQIFD